MRIATLQFSARVGEVASNFSHAESLLMREERAGKLQNLDLLVLPELAFTGYNHPSLSAIAPYLEPTAAGPSTRWATSTAKRLRCTVAVGYPEAATRQEGDYNTVYDAKISEPSPSDGDTDGERELIAYNSLVFVDSTGEVVAHSRKSFLYYSDEVWAKEGDGFYSGILPIGEDGRHVMSACGICMDINPYRFEAPWTNFEFASHCLKAKARLVVLSMAWLTRLTHKEMFGEAGVSGSEEVRATPDMGTISYWVERFQPLLSTGGGDFETIVVFANRTGAEGIAERIGEVRYAGSSTVMGMRRSGPDGGMNLRIWDVLGRGQEGMLVVDTETAPKYGLQQRPVVEAIDNADDATIRSATDPEKVAS